MFLPPSNIRPSKLYQRRLYFLSTYILNTRYLFYFSDPRSKVKDAANQGCNTAEDGQDAGVQLLLRTRRVSRVSPQLPGLAAAAENCTETCPRQLHLIRNEEEIIAFNLAP